MGSYNYTHTCGRCATTLIVISNADAQAWKDDAANGGHKATCGACGSVYTTKDDGVAIGSGGGVDPLDQSPPKVDSINIATGPIAGGTVIRFDGDALQVPGTTPVAKFGGIAAAAPSVLSDVAMDVTTPAGKAKLLLTEHYLRVEHGTVTSGPFQAGDTITGGTSTETAEVMFVGADFLLVKTLSGALTASETLTGSGSGASAAFSVMGDSAFSDGETITGGTSGATATMQTGSLLEITGPSGAFTPDEEITGASSGAMAQLGNPTWYDGTVDVSVENDNGQRQTGGSLPSAFQFTI
jgi:hypothetical protein